MTVRTTIGPTIVAVALTLVCVACSSGGSSGLRSTVPGTGPVDTGGSVPTTAAPGTNTLTATFVPAGDVASTYLDKSATVLRRRIGDLGIHMASVKVAGGQISVRLGGVADADVESVEAALVAPGQLSFHPVLAEDWQAPLAASADGSGVAADPSLAAKACTAAMPASVTVPPGAEVAANTPAAHPSALTCSLVGASAFDGSVLSGAKPVYAQTGVWAVAVTFNHDDVDEVNRVFNACYDGNSDADAGAVCPPTGTGIDGARGRLAVVSDGFVLSAPTIDARDLGMNPNGIEIYGQFTKTSAQRLALVLRAGALPVTFDPPAWHVTPN